MTNCLWLLRQGRLLVVAAILLGSMAYAFANESLNASRSGGQLTKKIVEFGVTWTFGNSVRYGQFANGHHWVLAPVTVVSISPEFDGAHHGWEINPDVTVAQGFDDRIDSFDVSRVPLLPYSAKPGESLVKTVSILPLSKDKCRPCIESASILTIVDRVPTDEGRTVFRPPYFGSDKTRYTTTNLRMDLLPQLFPGRVSPTFKEISNQYAMPQLDHKLDWLGERIHPKKAMPNYGSDIAIRNAAAALTLMLRGSVDDKWDALVRYVNNGIDIYHMMLGGVTWPANGGGGEGRKLPAVFAAILLDDSEMIANLRNSDRNTFGEDAGMRRSSVVGTVLFAQRPRTEDRYWRNLVFDTGARTIMDPYGYIDGGHRPGGSYQFCCTSKNWKATATALRLMPELIPVFNNDDYFIYVDRWVSFAAWTQPDPCAPPVGICSGGGNAGAACTTANEADVCIGTNAHCSILEVNWSTDYGVTYGPNGEGGCIVDTDFSDGKGRFPQLHGTNADGGHYGNRFADEMWAAYVARP